MSHQATKIFFSELSQINKLPKKNSYYEDTYKNLFKKIPFTIFPLKSERLEVDTIKDYKNLKKIIKRKNEYI